MRRALVAVMLGGTLLSCAACTRDTTVVAEATPTPTAVLSLPPLPDYTADTAAVCAQLQPFYQDEVTKLGAALGKMITYKEAKQAPETKQAEDSAAAELKTISAKIRTQTQAAQDPEFRAAGVISAQKIDASIKDRKYFAKISTLADLNTTIESQLAAWLSPVSGYCRTP